MYPLCFTMACFIQLEAMISVPGFDSDRKVNYGIVTLTFSTSVWNCESNFCFSVLSSIWKASSKTNGGLLFDSFQNKLWQISFLFSIWERKYSDYNLCFSIWEVSKRRVKKKGAVANDNLFWPIGFLFSIWERMFQNKY